MAKPREKKEHRTQMGKCFATIHQLNLSELVLNVVKSSDAPTAKTGVTKLEAIAESDCSSDWNRYRIHQLIKGLTDAKLSHGREEQYKNGGPIDEGSRAQIEVFLGQIQMKKFF